MKSKTSSSRRPLKQSTLFDYSSPSKESNVSSPSPQRVNTSRTQSPRKPIQTRLRSVTSTPKMKGRSVMAYAVSDDEDSSEDIGRIKLEGKEVSESSSSSASSSSEDSSDESEEVPKPTQAARLQKLRELVEEDTSEAEEPVRSRKSRGKRRAKVSDSDGETAPKRRRLTRTRKKAVSTKESDSDVDDLALDEPHVLESRLRERGKKTAFQKNLEKLRKRKQKQTISSSSSSGEDSEEEEVAASTSKPFKGAKPTAESSHGSLFGSDEDEEEESGPSVIGSDDFIVDDGPQGAPVLPAEFSMETHQDLPHQFKKVFQFFTHIATQPRKKRREFMKKNMEEEEYFYVPLGILRRKLDGIRDSLVASSVWRPEFKKALEKYPQFHLTQLEFAIPECDACHLGRRQSTLCGKLAGSPYDRMGFAILKEAEESSESESDDSGSPSNSKRLKTEFNLGRFCGRRTEVYHQFSHWEYELFCVIDQEIQELRDQEKAKKGNKFYRKGYGSGKPPPEDLTDGDDLTEWLDSRKVLEREWLKLKAMMESAHHLDMESKRGDKD